MFTVIDNRKTFIRKDKKVSNNLINKSNRLKYYKIKYNKKIFLNIKYKKKNKYKQYIILINKFIIILKIFLSLFF
jgi:hypothetical protein